MLAQLIQAISDVRAVRQAATQAKERWVELMHEGSAHQAAAKQAFLAEDARQCEVAGRLVHVMTQLREVFCLDIAVDALDQETLYALRRLIAELRLDRLLEPFKPTGLAALARAWLRAGSMHDAARHLVDCVRAAESVEDFERTLEDADGYRNPEAWRQTVAVYRLATEVMRFPGDDVAERISEAAHAADRHLQAVYDRLSEDMQTLLEDLHYSGSLGTALAQLDPEAGRRVRAAVPMLVRQRQLQPEIKPQTSLSVATLVEEETSDDFRG